MKTFNRIIFYLFGLAVMALGLSLNTKTGLGASPLLSLPYLLSTVFGMHFGDLAFAVYMLLIAAQFIIKGKDRTWSDALEIVYSLVFSRVLNLYAAVLPVCTGTVMRMLYIAGAVLFTGIGAAMVINTLWIADPCDAFVRTIAEKTGKDTGLIKNFMDTGFTLITLVLSLILTGKITGVGIGTVCAALGVGRIVHLYNKLFKETTDRLCFKESPINKIQKA